MSEQEPARTDEAVANELLAKFEELSGKPLALQRRYRYLLAALSGAREEGRQQAESALRDMTKERDGLVEQLASVALNIRVAIDGIRDGKPARAIDLLLRAHDALARPKET